MSRVVRHDECLPSDGSGVNLRLCMSVSWHDRVISLRCGIWSLSGHGGHRPSRSNRVRSIESAPWPSTRSAGYVKSVGIATQRAAQNAFADLGPRTTLRAGGKLLSTVNAICPVQPSFKKYFAFAVGQISSTSSPRPFPARGAYRDRHERGMGCGGRDSVGAQGGRRAVSRERSRRAGRTALVAYGKTVWSRHPLLVPSRAEAKSTQPELDQP